MIETLTPLGVTIYMSIIGVIEYPKRHAPKCVNKMVYKCSHFKFLYPCCQIGGKDCTIKLQRKYSIYFLHSFLHHTISAHITHF